MDPQNKLRNNAITQLLELKSLQTFLAIKQCQPKIINLKQSLLKKMVATSG
jgi:hypothetical protein